MADGETGQHKKRSKKWIILGTVVFLALVGFLVVTYVPLGDGSGSGVNVEFHAGKIEARNNSSRSASVSQSTGRELDLRRIAIINWSDHRVMQAIARRLAEDLRSRSIAEAVDLYDASGGAMPEPGGELYSTYITLDLPRFDATGLLATGRTVDATVKATIGPNFWNSRHGYTDHLTPPHIDAEAAVTIDHHSVSTGYETADAKYAQVIDNLAAETIKQVNGQLAEWAGKYELLETVPEGLMPAYRPVPDDLPLPDAPALTLLISGNALMAHNRTIWTVQTTDHDTLLRTMRQQLEAMDWRADATGRDADQPLHHFRAQTNDYGRVVEAFSVRPSWEDPVPGEPDTVVIRYTDRMTREEMRPIFERMLDDESIDVLALRPYDRNMTADLSERLWDALTERNDLPLADELHVIRRLNRNGNHEAAEARLNAAYLRAVIGIDDKRDDVVKLAEEINGDMSWTPTPPGTDELQAMGAKPIGEGETATIDVRLGQPALFYQWSDEVDSPNGLKLISATITNATIPEGKYKLTLGTGTFERRDGNMSVTPHSHETPWTGFTGYNRWYIEAKEVGPDRFEIKLTHQTPAKP